MGEHTEDHYTAAYVQYSMWGIAMRLDASGLNVRRPVVHRPTSECRAPRAGGKKGGVVVVVVGGGGIVELVPLFPQTDGTSKHPSLVLHARTGLAWMNQTKILGLGSKQDRRVRRGREGGGGMGP